MNDNIIPIFFTIDDEYAKFACTAITSIIENASKDELLEKLEKEMKKME